MVIGEVRIGKETKHFASVSELEDYIQRQLAIEVATARVEEAKWWDEIVDEWAGASYSSKDEIMRGRIERVAAAEQTLDDLKSKGGDVS